MDCSENHCKANDPCAWCGYSRSTDLVQVGIEAIEREHWHCRLNPSVPCGELAAADALRRTSPVDNSPAETSPGSHSETSEGSHSDRD